jgi:enoyl-CoA hydratase/carnithine racemase
MTGLGWSQLTRRSGSSGDGPLTWLVLNRPEKRNALSRKLLEEFGRALDVLATDEATRVIAIRGEGSTFSAGYDIERPSGPGTGTDIVDDFDRLAGNMERFLQVAGSAAGPLIAREKSSAWSESSSPRRCGGGRT